MAVFFDEHVNAVARIKKVAEELFADCGPRLTGDDCSRLAAVLRDVLKSAVVVDEEDVRQPNPIQKMQSWTRGVAMTLAEANRRGLKNAIVKEMAAEKGITLRSAVSSGLAEPYVEQLRAAGVLKGGV